MLTEIRSFTHCSVISFPHISWEPGNNLCVGNRAAKTDKSLFYKGLRSSVGDADNKHIYIVPDGNKSPK